MCDANNKEPLHPIPQATASANVSWGRYDGLYTTVLAYRSGIQLLSRAAIRFFLIHIINEEVGLSILLKKARWWTIGNKGEVLQVNGRFRPDSCMQMMCY